MIGLSAAFPASGYQASNVTIYVNTTWVEEDSRG